MGDGQTRMAAGGRDAREARAADERMAALAARLVTAEGRYQTPMLVDQLEYLYGMLTRADQKPGADAYERYAELEGKLDEIVAELELPANQSGVPMTYLVGGRQYVVVAVGARGHPGELVALRLPEDG